MHTTAPTSSWYNLSILLCNKRGGVEIEIIETISNLRKRLKNIITNEPNAIVNLEKDATKNETTHYCCEDNDRSSNIPRYYFKFNPNVKEKCLKDVINIQSVERF